MPKARDTSFDDLVVGYLKEGKSAYACANLIGKDRNFVIRIAKHKKSDLGEAFVDKLMGNQEDKEVSKALGDWQQYLLSENRQALLGRTLVKLEDMLGKCDQTKELRDLCVCVGILVDKFGVEQGYTNDSAKGALLKLFKDMEEETKEGSLE